MLSVQEMASINQRPAIPPAIARGLAEAAQRLKEKPVPDILRAPVNNSAIKGPITISGQGYFDMVVYPGPISQIKAQASSSPPKMFSAQA